MLKGEYIVYLVAVHVDKHQLYLSKQHSESFNI